MARFERGDIFLYSGSNIISFMIKRITKSIFSHTGWINQRKDVDESLDANGNGVEAKRFKYRLRRTVVLRLKIDAAKIAECVDFAEKQVGKKYDVKLFFRLLWRCLLGWRRKKDVGDWSSGYICSELVAMPLLMNAGLIFAPDVHPGNTVPGDIWNWARQNPDKVEFVYIGSTVRKALGSDCP